MEDAGTKIDRNSLPVRPDIEVDELSIRMAPDPSRTRLWLVRTFSSLRHRNYRLYFFGQMISQTGSWVQITALMWLAFDLTKSNRWPAWIVGLHIFPTCLLGPWGGVLALPLFPTTDSYRAPATDHRLPMWSVIGR